MGTNSYLALLTERIGGAAVNTDAQTCATALKSWSPIEAGQDAAAPASSLAAPAAIVTPEEEADVETLLLWANETQTAIVPLGGGSSLTGISAPSRRFVALDTSKLQHLDWDEESLLVHCGAGWTLGGLERTLNAHEYTLGQFPLSLDLLTVGGAISTDAFGAFAGKYGRFSDIVRGLTAVLGNGSRLSTLSPPLGSAGYDIQSLLIGAEGAFGIVTGATLQIRPAPEARAWAAFAFPTFDEGIDALRLIYRSDARPAGVTLLDVEAAGTLASDAALAPRGALLLLCFEGDEIVQTGHFQLAHAVCQQVGGKALDPELGDRYYETRRALPGADYAANGRPDEIADTLRICGRWSQLKAILSAVQTALYPLVSRHGVRVVSAGATGAALEIAFEASAGSKAAAIALYPSIVERALDACRRAGGAVAHHGGIGESRADAFAAERGAVAMDTLRSLQRSLDPNRVLNRDGH